MYSTFIYFILHLNSKRNQAKKIFFFFFFCLMPLCGTAGVFEKCFTAYRNQCVKFIKVTSEPFKACYFWGHFMQGELQKFALYLLNPP